MGLKEYVMAVDPVLSAQVVQSTFNPAWISAASAVIGVLFTGGGLLGAGIWKLGEVKRSIAAQAYKDKEEILKAVKEATGETEQKFYSSEELTGEALRGMRERCGQLELQIKDSLIDQGKIGMWVRDNFVNLSMHEKAVERLATQIDALGLKIESRTDRIDSQINELRRDMAIQQRGGD